MYGAYDFPRSLVAELEEVREVVLAEGGVVLLQAAYALLLLYGTLADETLCVRDALYLPAVLLPFLLYLLEFRYCSGLL